MEAMEAGKAVDEGPSMVDRSGGPSFGKTGKKCAGTSL
jgi:hypothetical protein